MSIFKALRGGSHRSQEQRLKTAARLSQITQTVCRRDMDGGVGCSPYAPCHEACPVIAAPADSTAAAQPCEATTPKSRHEVVQAIREAGARNSRLDLMRIVADHPLDFATAMTAFSEGLEAQKSTDAESTLVAHPDA